MTNAPKLDMLAGLSLNPTSKDGLKNVTSLCVLLDLALFVFVFSPIPLRNFPAASVLGVSTALILTRAFLFSGDHLETLTWSWLPEPKFFRANYPSGFLLQMCRVCTHPERCGNRPLQADSREYVAIWYQMFSSLKTENPELRQRTYEKGFTCRLVFYVKYTTMFFAVLASLTLAGQFVYSHFTKNYHSYYLETIFIVANVFLCLLISLTNRPDLKNPTGCWAMWRDVSAEHVLRLQQNIVAVEKKACDRFGRNSLRPARRKNVAPASDRQPEGDKQ